MKSDKHTHCWRINLTTQAIFNGNKSYRINLRLLFPQNNISKPPVILPSSIFSEFEFSRDTISTHFSVLPSFLNVESRYFLEMRHMQINIGEVQVQNVFDE